jgi:hypothetical protein
MNNSDGRTDMFPLLSRLMKLFLFEFKPVLPAFVSFVVYTTAFYQLHRFQSFHWEDDCE